MTIILDPVEVDFDKTIDVHESFNLNFNVNSWEFVHVNSNVWSDANVYDNTAIATGSAEAYGEDTFSKFEAFTLATDYSSTSTVFAISAVDDHDPILLPY